MQCKPFLGDNHKYCAVKENLTSLFEDPWKVRNDSQSISDHESGEISGIKIMEEPATPTEDESSATPDDRDSKRLTRMDTICKTSLEEIKQNSEEMYGNSWDEYTIPFNEIKFPPKSLIGCGQFAEVHRGYYYMDVAVKLLNMDHVKRENQLDAFREDVKTFMNTRHDNIILFIGCCLVSPYLGIVMNYCKGSTLHEILHSHGKETLSPCTKINVGVQLCQGMSYLHSRGIIHKDFRSKNVFIEQNFKVIISDFGLFNIYRLFTNEQQENGCKRIRLPEKWLCYQAPEIIQSLDVPQPGHVLYDFPFSFQSDIYAFGTILYELSTGRFPFLNYHPQTLIWQIGSGKRTPDLQEIYAMDPDVQEQCKKCWTYSREERPTFLQVYDCLSTKWKKLASFQRGGSMPERKGGACTPP